MHSSQSGIWKAITSSQPNSNDQSKHPTSVNQNLETSYQGRTRSQSQLIDGYTKLVADKVMQGWSCFFLTVMFKRLAGPRQAVIDRMKDQTEWLYRTLLTNVHRRPNNIEADQLLMFLGAVDLPVYKSKRPALQFVPMNNGLHVQVIVLVPPNSRLKGSLIQHMHDNLRLYVRDDNDVERIDVRPVTNVGPRLIDYVLKASLNGKIAYDDSMIVLPRAKGERTLH